MSKDKKSFLPKKETLIRNKNKIAAAFVLATAAIMYAFGVIDEEMFMQIFALLD